MQRRQGKLDALPERLQDCFVSGPGRASIVGVKAVCEPGRQHYAVIFFGGHVLLHEEKAISTAIHVGCRGLLSQENDGACVLRV